MQDHRDDVLADVVHVALDRGDDDFAFWLGDDAGAFFFRQLFFFDVRNQVGHGLLHHARRFHHLRQEHLALAEQVADDVHAIHERAFDHVDRTAVAGGDLRAHFFGVFRNPLGDAVHQCVRQALFHRRVTPFQIGGILLAGAGFQRAGEFDHAFGGVFAAVQYHVFHALAQVRWQVIVHAHHAGVDDAHGHTGLDGVVQEHGVDRFTCRVVAAERERDVGDAARNFRVRQVLFDPARGVDEVHRIVVVFFDTGGDGKDVRVEDDVFRREADLFGKHLVGAAADFDFAFVGIGLAGFVEGHDDDGSAVAQAQLGLADEFFFAFLHRDGVDDGLTLHAFEACFDHRPFGRVDHDGHARDVRFGSDQVQEARHGRLRVQHRFVHIDVDDLRTVLHLLAGDTERFVILLVEDHAREGFGTRDVGPFADVDEQRAVVDGERLQAGQALRHRHFRHGARLHGRQDFTDRLDVVRRGAAAATGDVDEARFGKFLEQRRGVGWEFVKAGVAHRVGQAGVRVDTHKGIGDLRQLFSVRAHQRRAQCAVQANRQRLGVAYRVPERGHGLAGQDTARGIGHGARDHQRQAWLRWMLFVVFVDGEQRGLAVQRIEDGFHQQQIDAAFNQALGLLIVGVDQLVEGDVTRSRVVHVRRDRGRLWRRSQCAGDEARLVRCAVLGGGGARQPGRFHVHLIGQLAHVVIVLRDPGGAEGVGFDDVGAAGQIALVDFLDHVRLRQRQQLVIPFDEQFARTGTGGRSEVDEPAVWAAAIGDFIQFVLLDDGAHRAVEDHDAARENLAQLGIGRGHDGAGYGVVHLLSLRSWKARQQQRAV